MNNTVENDFFGFPKVKWLHLAGEVDKSVKFHVKFSQDMLFLFLSRPRSEGWPHHGRTFSIYPCPLSF